MPIQFGGPGVEPSLGNLVSTEIVLQSGAVWCPSAGRWGIKPDGYSTWQEYDPITGTWVVPGAGSSGGGVEVVFCDGSNYRLANQTGCPVGASVTAAGSGYSTTSPPTWTASAGGSVFKSVIGGAVNTSVSVTAGGSNYTYPPLVLFSAPPPGGVPATGYCTLSAGAVSTVTVTDQGGGYVSPPTVTFVNDPREQSGAGAPAASTITTGTGAAAVCTLTGAGTLIAVLCTDHGQGGQTAVPTLTISSGSGAATAIMCWSITAYVISTTTAGSGYSAPIIISGYDTAPSQSANTNPTISSKLVKTRNAFIVGAISGSGVSATGQVVKDGGIYTALPTMFVASTGIQGAGAVQVTFLASTMGGQTSTCRIYPT
jgi:hypothetical protein